jgi:hypothetical protein
MYVLLFTCLHQLPWMDLRSKGNRINAIGKLKNKISKEELTRNMPKCFLYSFVNLQKLSDSDRPDY